jgi:hypothetical protein
VRTFLLILLFLLLLAIGVAAFLVGVQITVWNLNDIAAKGANFWNVFWLLLVGVALFGGASKAVSS